MRTQKYWSFAVSVLVGSILSASVLTLSTTQAKARRAMLVESGSVDNEPLYHLFEDDQADRLAFVEGARGAAEIKKSESDRLGKVLRMVRADQLHTGRDFFRAAAVVQRSQDQQNILLAHDLSICALSMGEKQAAPIAVSTEDRFLLARGLGQRFGTQSEGTEARRVSDPDSNSVTSTMKAIAGVSAGSDAQLAPRATGPTS